jgi:hypothetical protein
MVVEEHRLATCDGQALARTATSRTTGFIRKAKMLNLPAIGDIGSMSQ